MRAGPTLEERIASQQALMQVLRDGPSGATSDPGGTRGVEAYRTNAQVLAGQALSLAFPRLQSLLGQASFLQMAWTFWRHSPPIVGDMGEWGADLPLFLYEHGVESWWVDIAKVEWAAHQVERSREDRFDANSLNLLVNEDPNDITLLLRCGSVVLTVDQRAWTCWQDPVQSFGANNSGETENAKCTLQLLVWRAQWRAQVESISSAEADFMSALIRGMSLGQALLASHHSAEELSAQGVASETAFDFTIWLQRALTHGWLVGAMLL